MKGSRLMQMLNFGTIVALAMIRDFLDWEKSII